MQVIENRQPPNDILKTIQPFLARLFIVITKY